MTDPVEGDGSSRDMAGPWQLAVARSPEIRNALAAGCDARGCAVVLLLEVERLRARVAELMQIAPRKYRRADGVVYVWHCPDDMVPDAVLPDTDALAGEGTSAGS